MACQEGDQRFCDRWQQPLHRKDGGLVQSTLWRQLLGCIVSDRIRVFAMKLIDRNRRRVKKKKKEYVYSIDVYSLHYRFSIS